MTDTNIDTEVRAWIDRLAIDDLIRRYSDAVTRADWDQHEAVFAPDAVLEVGSPYDFRAEGARTIRERTSEGSARLEYLIHTVDTSVIQLFGPDRAQATSTIHEMGRGMSPGLSGTEGDIWISTEQYAIYYDDIVKIDDEWKFARRFCQPIYFAESSMTGQSMAPRSALLRTENFPPRT